MNTELVHHVHCHVLPAALDLLPSRMDTSAARAMLLAIGMQESDGFRARTQYAGGPAHGLWQFERNGGVRAVIEDNATSLILVPVLHTLNYTSNIMDCWNAITDNDTLAAVFARLLLWTCPGGLPDITDPERGWTQYYRTWRPGKPHRATWDAYFHDAWRITLDE